MKRGTNGQQEYEAELLIATVVHFVQASERRRKNRLLCFTRSLLRNGIPQRTALLHLTALGLEVGGAFGGDAPKTKLTNGVRPSGDGSAGNLDVRFAAVAF